MQMKFSDFIQSLNIDFSKYELKESYFDHLSIIHDLQHTYRVMLNVLRLGYLLNDPARTRLAFAGAFIHDMARINDKPEPKHGLRACRTKKHLIPDEFDQWEFNQIMLAVRFHTLKEFIPTDRVSLILRDADLLDRFRLTCNEQFRFSSKEAQGMIEFSKGLLERKLNIDVFSNLISRDVQ